VSAIFELESESVAEREMRESADAVRGRGADFESSSALRYEEQVASEQEGFKSRAALIAPGLKVRTELRKLANAVSIEATPQQITAISAIPGVKQVSLTREYQATLDTSVPLIKASSAWSRLGGSSNAGQGMKIAILDTGIDISNPLFNDAGFVAPAGFPKTTPGSETLANNKVIVAKSFVPGDDATDRNGHGSNVAGIAAGDLNTLSPLGNISGVAPRAYLGNYRVLNGGGSGGEDFIALALEQAVSDGFDVMSLSLGSTAGSQLGLLDRAVETAVNAGGKIVVIAAGNDGNGGVDDSSTVASPGIAPSAITVAASTNGHIVGPIVRVTGPDPVPSSITNIIAASGNAVALDGSLSALQISDADPQGRGCGALQASTLSGKIALIERGPASGGCSFATKVNDAAAAGAKAAIIFNYDASENPTQGGEVLINMEVSGTTIPSVFITHSAGLALRAFAQANPTMQVSINPVGSAPFTPDVAADFSSRGPSSIDGLKPDVTAPGVIIYSAAIKTPNSNGVSDPSGFTEVSGTSQATPHVAGAAALIKQLNPSFTPAQVKSALISSAVDEFLDGAKTQRAGVLTEGGGRIDLDRASSISAIFSPANLSFGRVKNKKKVTVTMDFSVTAQRDGNTSYALSLQELDPDPLVEASLSRTSVSLNKGESAAVTLTIFAAKQAEKRDHTGFVLVAGSDGQTLRIPYWILLKKKI
jgi:subtilisin family serine protease